MAKLDSMPEKMKNEEPLPRELNPLSFMEPELSCQAVEQAPFPYILNIGCGYVPTSVGFRTKDSVPLGIVGVDPKAYEIGDALRLLAMKFPIASTSRRFVMPLVAEEMSTAIPHGTYHAVWSSDALLDCVDPVRFVQQCVRALKTGGVACIKFRIDDEGTLWKPEQWDGGKILFRSQLGLCGLTEVRGERVEIHTLLDGSLMIKVRRREHTVDDAAAAAKKLGLILPGTGSER